VISAPVVRAKVSAGPFHLGLLMDPTSIRASARQVDEYEQKRGVVHAKMDSSFLYIATIQTGRKPNRFFAPLEHFCYLLMKIGGGAFHVFLLFRVGPDDHWPDIRAFPAEAGVTGSKRNPRG
jgi:hypothetical protein